MEAEPEARSVCTVCKSCRKPVLFVKDEKGTWQILDAGAPVFILSGFVEDVGRSVAEYGARALVEVSGCERVRHAFVSHFVTCPNASAHSIRGNAAKPSGDPR